MSTQQQRQEWRKLAEAATPGEWAAVTLTRYGNVTVWAHPGGILTATLSETNAGANGDFIAAARAAVPALLADVDALTQERDALTAELASYKRQAAYISSVIESEGKYVP